MILTPNFGLDLKQGNNDVKTRFLAFDLDLHLNLVKVRVDLHTKYTRQKKKLLALSFENFKITR